MKHCVSAKNRIYYFQNCYRTGAPEGCPNVSTHKSYRHERAIRLKSGAVVHLLVNTLSAWMSRHQVVRVRAKSRGTAHEVNQQPDTLLRIQALDSRNECREWAPRNVHLVAHLKGM